MSGESWKCFVKNLLWGVRPFSHKALARKAPLPHPTPGKPKGPGLPSSRPSLQAEAGYTESAAGTPPGLGNSLSLWKPSPTFAHCTLNFNTDRDGSHTLIWSCGLYGPSWKVQPAPPPTTSSTFLNSITSFVIQSRQRSFEFSLILRPAKSMEDYLGLVQSQRASDG